MSLARFHVGEIFFTYELGQRFADRQQQGFRRSPAPHRPQFQAIALAVAMPRYLAERFVAFQERVQRTQFVECLGRKRLAHMLANEPSEPLAQSTSLVRNLVELPWDRSDFQIIQCIHWNKLGLSQPS